MGQDNADAANNVSKWTGTVYLFSLVGAFLSDSYWGRYKTSAFFQAILLHLIGILNFRSSKGSFDYISSSFCRFIYTTALDVLGKANRPVEALNVFHSMQIK
ncbi:protein nrt1/ ptr family 7.1 [Quercus suber]|uniref:Protein nrt1/ ptr family 7.1 n=1 Tax=Quercus suber TaxID=58331 RepID=A0AAW0KSY0_QUESU